ncbi:MAG: aminodeoxychorismate/anthranilate synthase component II [Bacteroidota bacterium]
MNILVIDNYDSFTYNLVHLLRDMEDLAVQVRRNDRLGEAEIAAAAAIVLSPGPGLPKNAGRMPALLTEIAGKKPILGVCLGLQAIVEHYGGTLENLDRVYHGRSSEVSRVDAHDPLLAPLPETFTAGRYHSWVAHRPDLPEQLVVSSETADGAIMSVYHREDPVFGLQFHPESVLTPRGADMLQHFVNYARNYTTTLSNSTAP